MNQQISVLIPEPVTFSLERGLAARRATGGGVALGFVVFRVLGLWHVGDRRHGVIGDDAGDGIFLLGDGVGIGHGPERRTGGGDVFGDCASVENSMIAP